MNQQLLRGLLWLQALFTDINGSGRENEISTYAIDLSDQWQVLGPFQIGTREATWSADPLEYLGGFRQLHYDPSRMFSSSLGINGSVGWSTNAARTLSYSSSGVESSVAFEFPDIDWSFLQSIYGWAALQYQAWARGMIINLANRTQTVRLHTDGIIEFAIDGKRYFGGDLYAYRRAPLLLHLSPGSHQFDLRLTRDVRAMGGVGSPVIVVNLKAEISSSGLVVDQDRLLLPELVDGRLASHLGSIPVRNEGREWIDIIAIKPAEEGSLKANLRGVPLSLAPGQTRPLGFDIIESATNSRIAFTVEYRIRSSPCTFQSSVISSTTTRRNIDEPHRITFLHPSGIVSYAILRCPKDVGPKVLRTENLPVLLNLHGAGLEADSYMVRHMLDEVKDIRAWIIFPTGVTAWSGDDWHTWGFPDVEAAINAISCWIRTSAWDGPGVDVDRWYVSGHSNGGQGTWFALTHQPDKIMAAAPVSGYSSIQAYVPYQFWREIDPRLASMLQISLVSYRLELLVDNFAGIPILQQHGSADENVPAYHSRRLQQLIIDSGWQSQYVELAGRGHWFDKIMTTTFLRDFYRNISEPDALKAELPECFSIIVPNSGEMGSRGGIVVDQLRSPDQLGRIDVVQIRGSSIWTLRTSNIRRFHLDATYFQGQEPAAVEVDGSHFFTVRSPSSPGTRWFVRASCSSWTLSSDESWQSVRQRYGAQRGALDAILRTQGPFVIQSQDQRTFETAVQIARNLFQYFAADSELVDSIGEVPYSDGNIISVVHGSEMLPSNLPLGAIEVNQDRGIIVRDALGYTRTYPFVEGLGAIYIQPLSNERLRLIVWGFDKKGLDYAARLVPMLTGVGQADFVVISKACHWKGAGGVFAMGLLDYAWNVSHSSYLT